jgi:transposase
MPRIKGPRKINRYPDEFKVRAVRMSALPRVQVQDVAHALDIHPFMLSRWRKLVREGVLVADDDVILDPETTAELQRLRQIERDYALLKEEHALLKKAIRFCSERKRKSSRSSSRTGKPTMSR